jgi:hypothetical protein
MKGYRIDWIQLAAALTTMIAFTAVMWSVFALYIAWPVATPGMVTALIASGVWSHRHEVNQTKGAQR